jgi:hypothetical protein
LELGFFVTCSDDVDEEEDDQDRLFFTDTILTAFFSPAADPWGFVLGFFAAVAWTSGEDSELDEESDMTEGAKNRLLLSQTAHATRSFFGADVPSRTRNAPRRRFVSAGVVLAFEEG